MIHPIVRVVPGIRIFVVVPGIIIFVALLFRNSIVKIVVTSSGVKSHIPSLNLHWLVLLLRGFVNRILQKGAGAVYVLSEHLPEVLV